MLQFFYVIQNHREEEYIWKDEAWACISGFTSLNFSFSNLKELYISLIYISTQILWHSWIERHLTIFWQKVHFLGQILDYKGQIMSKFELNGTKKPSTEIRTAPFYLRRYGMLKNHFRISVLEHLEQSSTYVVIYIVQRFMQIHGRKFGKNRFWIPAEMSFVMSWCIERSWD